ncbi:MAG: helix-turn-helix domain-containing protein [Anaerolineae bacterium]|nr:helix-turn-helix domain-containing protein [Anaerolineae bacterium]MBT7075909.1 helix-turn-helix domain-containing protein [Anaerolineae bacterium]MBT7781998.1 helix-turn-helix domain-containing protein [Anaerolineae bacterium]
MELYENDAISVNVGSRLRELRSERNLSIRALARKSGLSANALSMIERDKTSPSVSTLYKLADGLGVPITSFFGEQTDRESVVFVKADQRTHVPFQRGTWEGLGGQNFIGKVEPFVLTLQSGANSGMHTLVHTGHEFVFCLRGELEYQVEDEYYTLEAGDSLMFSARLRHRWRNIGGNVTNVLFLLSGFAEGERPTPMHMAKQSKADEKSNIE